MIGILAAYLGKGQPRGRLKLSLVKKEQSLLSIRREDVSSLDHVHGFAWVQT